MASKRAEFVHNQSVLRHQDRSKKESIVARNVLNQMFEIGRRKLIKLESDLAGHTYWLAQFCFVQHLRESFCVVF
ncbi:MAG: hypothetical protein ACI97A_003281 [Planctomycetota bacterium]|jgi:hypothetical protein